MWLEMKAMMTVVAMIFIAIVLSQVLLFNFLYGFLLFAAIGMYAFGDIILGYQITRTHANKIMDKPPSGKVMGVVFTITGLIDFVWATKKPHGKREFVFNKEDASVIDRGNYPVHFLNGAYGFICHESCDENLSMPEVKYAEGLRDDFKTNDLKEIYARIKEAEAETL